MLKTGGTKVNFDRGFGTIPLAAGSAPVSAGTVLTAGKRLAALRYARGHSAHFTAPTRDKTSREQNGIAGKRTGDRAFGLTASLFQAAGMPGRAERRGLWAEARRVPGRAGRARARRCAFRAGRRRVRPHLRSGS